MKRITFLAANQSDHHLPGTTFSYFYRDVGTDQSYELKAHIDFDSTNLNPSEREQLAQHMFKNLLPFFVKSWHDSHILLTNVDDYMATNITFPIHSDHRVNYNQHTLEIE